MYCKHSRSFIDWEIYDHDKIIIKITVATTAVVCSLNLNRIVFSQQTIDECVDLRVDRHFEEN